MGQPIRRSDDRRYLTGQARFLDDLAPPGTVYATFVRSPFAHARIVGVDARACREVPGVVHVLTGAEARGHL
ncbi:MAG: hypothetical protein HY724_12445, partial [Candidatus Rokubacteria bacterium]|nr:hypothetical protein [Candidatus Rokubacteria bacterium]